MRTSQQGIDFIKTWECSGKPLLKAIKLTGEKYYTIGYGHYGADVAANATITAAQAEEMLKADLVQFEKSVTDTCSRYAKFVPNQNQFDALVSFTYNCGPGSLKQLVSGRTAGEAASHMMAYTGSANESFREGLARRRRAEREMFLKAPEKKEATAMAATTGSGDHPGAGYKEATEWAKRAGLFGGDGKGNYDWQQPVTREQLALILYRFGQNCM